MKLSIKEVKVRTKWGSDQKYQLLLILNYLTGSDLLHRVALLNQTTRRVIQNSGLLT